MKKKDKEYFKKLLLDTRLKIINQNKIKSKDGLVICSEDLLDEVDLANSFTNQHISFSIHYRELKKLKDIENALDKIKYGTYGLCEDCDEEIEYKRLESKPWARLCIIHAEDKEINTYKKAA